jgi:hypothetical protein
MEHHHILRFLFLHGSTNFFSWLVDWALRTTHEEDEV